MADVPDVRPTPLHIWDEDGLGAPDVGEVTHLKHVDRYRRTANGDPVVVFTDGSTLTFFAPLVRGSTYVPLSVLYREPASRGRPVPADRKAAKVFGLPVVEDESVPPGEIRVESGGKTTRIVNVGERTDGNVHRDKPTSRPRPHAGPTTRKKSPSRHKG